MFSAPGHKQWGNCGPLTRKKPPFKGKVIDKAVVYGGRSENEWIKKAKPGGERATIPHGAGHAVERNADHRKKKSVEERKGKVNDH